MPVGELLHRVDSEELSEWLAFDNLYTLPDLYFVAGVLGMAIHRAFGGASAKVTPADFVPFFAAQKRELDRAKPRMSGDEIRGKLRGWIGTQR